MLVVEIDDVHAEPREARVAGLRDVGRTPVHEVTLAVRAPDIAELGGEDDALAPPLERAPERLLVVPPAVQVRGVEEVHTPVERGMDHADGLLVVALAVRPGHRHQAETHGRDTESAPAEGAMLHWTILAHA